MVGIRHPLHGLLRARRGGRWFVKAAFKGSSRKSSQSRRAPCVHLWKQECTVGRNTPGNAGIPEASQVFRGPSYASLAKDGCSTVPLWCRRLPQRHSTTTSHRAAAETAEKIAVPPSDPEPERSACHATENSDDDEGRASDHEDLNGDNEAVDGGNPWGVHLPLLAAVVLSGSFAGLSTLRFLSAHRFFAGRMTGRQQPGSWNYEWDAWRFAKGSPEQEPQQNPYTRHIILVRHAQFDSVDATDDEALGLTSVGRLQAEVTGERLKAVLKDKRVSAIYHSNMRRARETAEIIASKLGDTTPGITTVQDPLLAEGVPAMPIPPSTVFHPAPATVEADSKRIEEAFRRYFYRGTGPDLQQQQQQQLLLRRQQQQQQPEAAATATANSKSTANSSTPANSKPLPTEEYSIIVCHGNVIRYFFCRALQLPASAWLRLATFNCGITWLSIDRRGYVSARQFGDTGHLNPSIITYR
ncbi:serine/threonine-protein phosphatase Pgam5, mitochondrial [Cyclospora cayetanensis]|uniref:Serine/threonine-protein phosphatase PGAM5, mitochondrial n=1 Tax=Cyclospora cayetanensis TaxID=88456 RepID=A0A6P6RZY5_9EIME|nr:serine/threonine-protein phosphatase Pgam5, mitochondrial [Cyclospora cayetanensis]